MGNSGEGFGHTPAYVVSALPWVTGSVSLSTTPFQVKLPKVSKFVRVSTTSGSATRVGFTSNGVNGTNYYRIQSGSSVQMDLRVCELYLRMDSGAGEVDIMAGLTTIPSHMMGPLTGSTDEADALPGAGWPGVG